MRITFEGTPAEITEFLYGTTPLATLECTSAETKEAPEEDDREPSGEEIDTRKIQDTVRSAIVHKWGAAYAASPVSNGIITDISCVAARNLSVGYSTPIVTSIKNHEFITSMNCTNHTKVQQILDKIDLRDECLVVSIKENGDCSVWACYYEELLDRHTGLDAVTSLFLHGELDRRLTRKNHPNGESINYYDLIIAEVSKQCGELVTSQEIRTHCHTVDLMLQSFTVDGGDQFPVATFSILGRHPIATNSATANEVLEQTKSKSRLLLVNVASPHRDDVNVIVTTFAGLYQNRAVIPAVKTLNLYEKIGRRYQYLVKEDA